MRRGIFGRNLQGAIVPFPLLLLPPFPGGGVTGEYVEPFPFLLDLDPFLELLVESFLELFLEPLPPLPPKITVSTSSWGRGRTGSAVELKTMSLTFGRVAFSGRDGGRDISPTSSSRPRPLTKLETSRTSERIVRRDTKERGPFMLIWYSIALLTCLGWTITLFHLA